MAMEEQNLVLAALARQTDVYRRLAKLARIQHEHVQAGRTDDLLRVLSQRQDALNEISELEQTIGPVKRRWQEFLGELEISQRGEAESLMAESRELLEEITQSDRNDSIVLQQRKHNLGAQIGKSKNAQQFNRNYAVTAYGQRRPALDIKQ
jgi:HAMP domain-containing protein